MRLPLRPSVRKPDRCFLVVHRGVAVAWPVARLPPVARASTVQRESDRLENVAAIYMTQVARMARGGASLQAISAQIDQSAGDASVRVLLLDDRGGVLHDTDNNRYTGGISLTLAPQSRRHP